VIEARGKSKDMHSVEILKKVLKLVYIVESYSGK